MGRVACLGNRRVAFLAETDAELAASVRGLQVLLEDAGHAVVAWRADADADAVVVVSDRPPGESVDDALLERLRSGVPVLLVGPTLDSWRDRSALTEALGVEPGRRTPVHEIRVRPGTGRSAGRLAARGAADLLVTEPVLTVEKVADDVEVLLAATVGLDQHPLLTLRGQVGALTLGVTAGTLSGQATGRLVHRWLGLAWGDVEPQPIRVGLLGYGAIGAEHAAAVAGTDGLALTAICDRNPERLAAAAPELDAVRLTDPDELLTRQDVDLVVVSTPPNTHAEWALRVLAGGRHVVVEKPFALTTADADMVIAEAASVDRLVAVYQNRRWDPDYLALRGLVRSGAIGTVFHYESFVGGYGHPCNYWHSDAGVSGGALYDWGSHYLDWMLDLFPGAVEQVTAVEHKLVWHDVTNADHSRVTVAFADGLEAGFVHSDLAAALKPKWYVLGSRGAVVGSWRDVAVPGRGPVGDLVEDRLAPADSPAELTVHAPDGSVTHVVLPARPVAPFHRELADRLLDGWPMSVTAGDSRRGVAVMEAAAESARALGRPVRPQR